MALAYRERVTPRLTIFWLPYLDASISRPVKALLDTGNHASDFIASWVVDSLDLGAFVRESNNKTVCSGLDNACYDTSKSIRLFVSYSNDLTKRTASMSRTSYLLVNIKI